MAPPGTLGLLLLLLLLGAAAAQPECSGCLPGPGPIAALVAADVILTLLIAGGAYWLAGRGRPGGRGQRGGVNFGRGQRGMGFLVGVAKEGGVVCGRGLTWGCVCGRGQRGEAVCGRGQLERDCFWAWPKGLVIGRG
ncbi:TYRO protein tyrosine kinase-binding protein isoform X1 [Vidua chalybeata]|uniref:TYRO protein tyrosine kinase-binding protein isoform X1 n=1 Tax=Vidua chalybeata TaxID=81927 RepID=UPI0023A80EFD|nr:TYRO protein tyrosine kinase-binding protein isoform X1 [Vidua chalybeata]